MEHPPEISDSFNVLVFKDHYTSRAYRVPRAWIRSLGVTLSLWLLLPFVALGLLLKSAHDLKRQQGVERQKFDSRLEALRQNQTETEKRALPLQLAPLPLLFLPLPALPAKFQSLTARAQAGIQAKGFKGAMNKNVLTLQFELESLVDTPLLQGSLILFIQSKNAWYVYPTQAMGPLLIESPTQAPSFLNPGNAMPFDLKKASEFEIRLSSVGLTKIVPSLQILFFDSSKKLRTIQNLVALPLSKSLAL